MDPFTIAAVAAPVIGGLMSSSGQASANTANKNLSREQMQFQERMSSTAHVRQVEDLRAAGLNPILSANTGASAPTGSMATMQNEDAETARGIESAVTSSLANKRLSQDIKNLKAQEQKTNTETALLKANKPAAELKHDAGKYIQGIIEKFIPSAKKNDTIQKRIKKQRNDYKKQNPNAKPNKSSFKFINDLM